MAKEIFGDWNSKEAILKSANYCKGWREKCLREKISFVFETVFSAEDKIDFLIRAKESGFFIRVFFISTNHTSINASRIAKRVMEGGHDVPIPKIVSRYTKSIINCEAIASLVDRLYVYDNSVNDMDAKIQFRLNNGKLEKMYVSALPIWAQNIIPYQEV